MTEYSKFVGKPVSCAVVAFGPKSVAKLVVKPMSYSGFCYAIHLGSTFFCQSVTGGLSIYIDAKHLFFNIFHFCLHQQLQLFVFKMNILRSIAFLQLFFLSKLWKYGNNSTKKSVACLMYMGLVSY